MATTKSYTQCTSSPAALWWLLLIRTDTDVNDCAAAQTGEAHGASLLIKTYKT